MNRKRIIFHVDVNSAFLSWEATRRVLRGEPDLRLVPSVIGGDPTKRTSIVTAKSIPAKKFGIVTGEPVTMAMRKCPGLVVVPGDFALYRKCSKAFKDICREYTPVVQEFSIDEVFMDMTGMGRLYPDPVKTANEIRERIKEELGFTVNVGIGPNKLLAKMASDFEKPDKVHTLWEEEIPAKMWTLPVGDLLFVGKKSVPILQKAQIRTIGDLAKMDVGVLKTIVGEKAAVMMHEYANGVDESPVTTEQEEAKGFSVSTTLEENVTTYEEAQQILLELSDSVTSRMRREKAKAGCVAVTIRDNEFVNRSHQMHLPEATDITNEIYETAKELFRMVWDGKTPLRLLKVALSDLDRDGAEQFSLFVDEQKEKERKMDKAMDALRDRFGTGVVQRGSTMNGNHHVGKKFQKEQEE